MKKIIPIAFVSLMAFFSMLAVTGIGDFYRRQTDFKYVSQLTKDLSGWKCYMVQLDNFDFKGLRLNNTKFIACSMRGAKLAGMNLPGISLMASDLTHADLQNTVLAQANLTKCTLSLRT